MAYLPRAIIEGQTKVVCASGLRSGRHGILLSAKEPRIALLTTKSADIETFQQNFPAATFRAADRRGTTTRADHRGTRKARQDLRPAKYKPVPEIIAREGQKRQQFVLRRLEAVEGWKSLEDRCSNRITPVYTSHKAAQDHLII